MNTDIELQDFLIAKLQNCRSLQTTSLVTSSPSPKKRQPSQIRNRFCCMITVFGERPYKQGL